MKNNYAMRLISLTLAVVLCLGLSVPAMAAVYEGYPGLTFSATLDKPTINLNNDEAQPVVLIVAPSQTVQTGSITYSISVPSGLELTSIASNKFTDIANFASVTNKTVNWFTMGDDYTDVNEIGILTFSVPAGTPVGEYEITISGIELTNNANTYPTVDGVSVKGSATATLTITDGKEDEIPSDAAYTASVSTTATNNTVVNGQDIVVNVNVGGTVGSFNSAEIILEYDPTYLTYKSAATTSNDEQEPDYEVDATNGTLTIRDYGDVINAANGVYSVTFTAAKGGNTNVELKSAGFSTKDEAEFDDLTVATGLNTLDVTINHKVTVNNSDAGSVAPDGTTDYTFKIENYDPDNNEYTVTATEGSTNVPVDRISIAADGTVTITNITGDLNVTWSVKANEYTVTWVDSESVITNKNPNTYTVTHGTDITFDVPDNQDPVGTTDGYKYTVKVTLDDNDQDDTNNAEIETTSAVTSSGTGLTYTIDGEDITGNITITVKKETVDANQVTVTITGDDLKASVNGEDLTSPATIEKDSDVVLTLSPETGYTYEVKVNGEGVTLTDNKYTIENIAESVIVTVTKTLDKTSVKVQEYLTLDGTQMWLVTVNGNGTTQIENKTYSYDNGNMYWSSKYNAYCYLVVSETLNVEVAKTAIGGALVAQAATEVDYGMDVNISNTVDVNDAQLVWNMYSAEYSGFTTNVNMEKFLRADVNGSQAVDTSDAAAIITAIKNA